MLQLKFRWWNRSWWNHFNLRWLFWVIRASPMHLLRKCGCVTRILQLLSLIYHIWLIRWWLVKFFQFYSRNKWLHFLNLILYWLSLIGSCGMCNCSNYFILFLGDKFIKEFFMNIHWRLASVCIRVAWDSMLCEWDWWRISWRVLIVVKNSWPNFHKTLWWIILLVFNINLIVSCISNRLLWSTI